MTTNKVLLGGAIALLLGFIAYKTIEKVLEIDDIKFGFEEDEIFGM